MPREVRFHKPEFQEKLARARQFERKIGSARWPRYLVFILALILLYYLAISKTFLVHEASMNENGPSTEQVRVSLGRLQSQRLWYVVPSNHILVLDKASLLPELRKQEPGVRSIKALKKSWPNQLALNVEMREPRYVWQTGQDFYLLDQDGVVFQQIPGYTPETFSQDLIVDTSGATVEAGMTLAIRPVIKFIEDVRRDWPAKINETNIVSFAVPAARSKDIIVRTQIGFGLYFDLERGVSEQLADLKIVLREQIRPETYEGLSYIDLRLPPIAYYCYKDAPCAPEYATSTPATN